MIKKYIQSFCFLLLILTFCLGIRENAFAGVTVPSATEVKDVSISYTPSGNIIDDMNTVGFKILTSAKIILAGVLIIFMVYIGIQMIISMGDDEDLLSKAKKQIMYALIALLFINIPGSIYDALHQPPSDIGDINASISTSGFKTSDLDGNIFMNFFEMGYTLNDNIIGFLKILIFGIAVFMIVLAGINIVNARGHEERVAEAKSKIIYTILALIFLGIIELWKTIAFDGAVRDGADLFQTLAELALFLAGPVAIFFMTLAGYYYITSNGDPERAKKGKSIIINTILATLILLACYTFLLDLSTI